jgi:hypothetical protein
MSRCGMMQQIWFAKLVSNCHYHTISGSSADNFLNITSRSRHGHDHHGCNNERLLYSWPLVRTPTEVTFTMTEREKYHLALFAAFCGWVLVTGLIVANHSH